MTPTNNYTFDQYENVVVVTDELTGHMTSITFKRHPATKTPVLCIESEDAVHTAIVLYKEKPTDD